MISQQNVTIKSGSTWHKICPFPVGFIYLSQNSTSPATTFGGTWAALNEDRFLRPSNAWTTGGSKKISTKQLPAHSHNIAAFPNDGSGSSGNVMNVAARDGWGYFLYNTSCRVGEVEETGGGGRLLALLPRLLRLVSNCLTLPSVMEVSDNGNNAR